MVSYVAIYRGLTVAKARLIAVSMDAPLVNIVTESLLNFKPANQYSDPALRALDTGRRKALRILAQDSRVEGKQSEDD